MLTPLVLLILLWILRWTLLSASFFAQMPALNNKLKVMGGTIKFRKAYWALKILALWSSGLQDFGGKFKRHSTPLPCHIFNVCSLITEEKLSKLRSFIKYSRRKGYLNEVILKVLHYSKRLMSSWMTPNVLKVSILVYIVQQFFIKRLFGN